MPNTYVIEELRKKFLLEIQDIIHMDQEVVIECAEILGLHSVEVLNKNYNPYITEHESYISSYRLG